MVPGAFPDSNSHFQVQIPITGHKIDEPPPPLQKKHTHTHNSQQCLIYLNIGHGLHRGGYQALMGRDVVGRDLYALQPHLNVALGTVYVRRLPEQCTYCVSMQSSPILDSDYTIKIGQDFLKILLIIN